MWRTNLNMVTNSHWCCVSECIQTRIWLKIIFLYELSITFNRLIDFDNNINCSNSECMETFQAFDFFVPQDFSKIQGGVSSSSS